jgi:hypothetical protein
MNRAPISKLDFAQDTRRRGFRVYPMTADGEEPMFPEADCFATIDESQVLEWWEKWPDANIGISTENLLAIRISQLCTPEELEDTIGLSFVKHSPTKSLIIVDATTHVTFQLPAGVTIGACIRLSENIQVLSSSADDVIVAPGSAIEGKDFKFSHENSLVPAPPWLLELCGIELPESNSMNNVIPLKKAAPPAAAKTKLDWALEASQHVPVHPCRWYVDPGPDANPDERKKAKRHASAADRDNAESPSGCRVASTIPYEKPVRPSDIAPIAIAQLLRTKVLYAKQLFCVCGRALLSINRHQAGAKR